MHLCRSSTCATDVEHTLQLESCRHTCMHKREGRSTPSTFLMRISLRATEVGCKNARYICTQKKLAQIWITCTWAVTGFLARSHMPATWNVTRYEICILFFQVRGQPRQIKKERKKRDRLISRIERGHQLQQMEGQGRTFRSQKMMACLQ